MTIAVKFWREFCRCRSLSSLSVRSICIVQAENNFLAWCVEQFEEISRQVKAECVGDRSLEMKLEKFKLQSGVVKPLSSTHVPDIRALLAGFSKCGVKLCKFDVEVELLHLSMLKLIDQNALASVKLFGRITTTSGNDYHVVQSMPRSKIEDDPLNSFEYWIAQ